MNIDINLIPQELRPKPFIGTRTLVLIVVVVVLGFGCFYFFNAKSNAQSDTASMEQEILRMNQQAASLSTNQEAVALTKSIGQLKVAKQSYDSFVASKVLWGAALERVYALAPKGVDIDSIKQAGNSITIAGKASSYTDVARFGRDLDNEPKFALAGLPSFASTGFTLTINVAAGGDK